MSNELKLFIISALLFSLLFYVIYRILRNPFRYPYFLKSFDVTGKRNIKIEDYIDRFLNDNTNWQIIYLHEQNIKLWKKQTEKFLESCILKKYRRKQYIKILDDQNAYQFKTVRKQTRYRQKNYIKTSYKVSVVNAKLCVDWNWICNRYNQLKRIDFESTLNEYTSKNQRKLMTAALRKKIMQRDDYTCQICGKYMFDEVGLHIDHIIPIAKGGKSIESNLRVLCSKCNGHKGSK